MPSSPAHAPRPVLPTPTSPVSYASTTACTRSRSWSLVKIRATCVFTVASLSVSSAASSALLRPRAIRPSTSSSRGVSTDRSALTSAGAAWCPAYRSTSRRVMDGASSASPDRTSRTAAIRCSGETSLSRNPLAPAASAAYTYWSRSNVVKMMIRMSRPDRAPRIRRVASSPSSSGIRMSIKITSGRCLSAAATAS